MYNLERQLWYLHLLTRHCPCNLLAERTSPKHEYRWKLWGHPVTSSMTSSPWKENVFWRFGTIFSYLRWNWSCVQYFKIFKLAAILSSRQTFLPEVEYTRKIAIAFPTFWAFNQRSSWNIDRDISISKFYQLCDLVTSSMTSWICIYINVVIISWYLYTGSLMMISLLVFQLWKMLLFHL